MPLVEARGVKKSFGRTPVLNGIDFSLERSQVACLVGPSGSGKTTFLRCVNQLETINGGRIWIDGELMGFRQQGRALTPLKEKEIDRQRTNVGIVFQHFNLFRHRTVLENLIEAPVHVLGVSKEEATERALSMLERVGLTEKRDQYPNRLSGGQQQRVAIARALTMQPKLMLFDEPTSALDPELVAEVLSVMRSLAEDGTTMIVVTHEIEFAKDVADVAVFMDGGRVVETGPPRELFENPQHERLRKFLKKL